MKEYYPPAFPEMYDTRHEATFNTTEGMTLLDYFAAKAMNTLVCDIGRHEAEAYERCAERSYGIASAMIEERKKYIN